MKLNYKQALLRQIMVAISRKEDTEALMAQFMSNVDVITPEEVTEVAQGLEDEKTFDDYTEHIDTERKIFELVNVKVKKQNLYGFSKGHPIRSFLDENKVIRELSERAANLEQTENSFIELKSDWLLIAKQFRSLNLHYLRKENQLFPFLEKRGFSHPSSMMWSLHDEIRNMAKKFEDAVNKNDEKAAFAILPNLVRESKDMTTKEEKILLPTAIRLLTEKDWTEIRAGEDEIGWMIPEPPKIWQHRGKMGSYVKSTPERTKSIMGIIDAFFNNENMDYLKQRFKDELQDKVSPGEFALAEQKMADHGISDAQFKEKIDDLLKVFKTSLDKASIGDLPAGHPLNTFHKENEAIKRLIDDLRQKEKGVNLKNVDADYWAKAYDNLRQINAHYLRKENQLFPFLEKKGFDKPSTVMWALHDDIRALIKHNRTLLDKKEYNELLGKQGAMFDAIENMIFKEEKVLWPTSLELISDSEWTASRAGEDEIGYCLIESPPMWNEEKPQQFKIDDDKRTVNIDQAKPVPFLKAANNKTMIGGINLNVGSLTPEQINLIFGNMPFDITYIDKFDEVRYYNKGDGRIFPRSPGIIGREIRYCHPPKSIHRVMEIINDFKLGKRDKADFRINFQGKFILIQYFALRDNQGNYEGVLEITYDGTYLRSLKGEKRLLERHIK